MAANTLTDPLASNQASLSPHFLTRNQNINNYTPVFYRLHNENEFIEIKKLLSENSYILISDTIENQVLELVKALQPSRKFTPETLQAAITEHLNGTPFWQYGVWVYYPWSHRLVHILDEDEFALLRTNRNKHKITDEERATLATKKIGVIGLSVGQSVSVTLAMERSFGEIRIADFDELEITNLNRLRSGVHNMGIAKTVLVAREIAEIDPFLKVTPYHQGITAENLESFLLEGGKLDILIDECDSVDIKIQCRVGAKKHGIPVVMEASDRATIDVERFDLEPDRSILHGYIDHLDISKLKDLKTSEEKLPYMLPIAGVETLSTRMKASALEIGQTINTWPQLASAVTLGGGITADICRRMLLDQYHESGRYFIDIEELIKDKDQAQPYQETPLPELTLEDMTAMVEAVADTKKEQQYITLDDTAFSAIIEAAVVAPSAGNNQPWKWLKDGNRLWLFHDRARSYSFGDFEHMASYMALGTALQNIDLKAGELQFSVDIRLFPAGSGNNPIAVLGFDQTAAEATPKNLELAKYIPLRYTNRKKGNGELIDSNILSSLQDVVKDSEVHLSFVNSRDGVKELAEIIAQSERLRVFIPQGHYDLFEKELRFSPELAEQTGDGLDLRTFDFSENEKIGLRLAKDHRTINYLRQWGKGQGFAKMSRESAESFSAIGLVTMPQFSPESCITAGKAIEKIWLSVTAHNLAMQPMLAPLLHFARINYGGVDTMPADIVAQFKQLEQRFETVFELTHGKAVPLFLFRLGYASQPEVKSYRLPMEKILFTKRQGPIS